jgi:hypothetical protein
MLAGGKGNSFKAIFEKAMALSLVLSLIINLSCISTQRHLTTNNNIISYDGIEFIEGTLDVTQGEKGYLSTRSDSLLFIVDGKTQAILYENITSLKYNKELKNVQKNILIPSSFGPTIYALHLDQGSMFKQDYTALILLSVLAVGALLYATILGKTFGESIYLAIAFTDDNGEGWDIFKMQEKAFNPLYNYLCQKTGLK